MAENKGNRPQKNNNHPQRHKNNPNFKPGNRPNNQQNSAKAVRPQQAKEVEVVRAEPQKIVEQKPVAEGHHLKSHEIIIIALTIFLLVIIGFTISRNSLPQKNPSAGQEAMSSQEQTEAQEPKDILGYVELKDQYALCANFLFLSQYDAGNESGGMDILKIANEKYQRLTGEMIEQSPAMQPASMDILRHYLGNEVPQSVKDKLVKDCTNAITIFEEIYNRQAAIDAEALTPED